MVKVQDVQVVFKEKRERIQYYGQVINNQKDPPPPAIPAEFLVVSFLSLEKNTLHLRVQNSMVWYLNGSFC